MIIDCISDLHGYYPELEGGDLLIVAGDLTARDSYKDCHDFGVWLANQEYRKKIVIAGNHDNKLVGKDSKIQFICDMEDGSTFQFATYLCDSGTEFEGLKIWGSPWTPYFHGVHPSCKAFMLKEKELEKKWALIPDDTDILITHTPPYGVLDGILLEDGSLYHAGSKSLYGWIKYVERPKLHVFGHIHEGFGKTEQFPTYNDKMMKSVNASYVNEHYKPVNKPVRVIL